MSSVSSAGSTTNAAAKRKRASTSTIQPAHVPMPEPALGSPAAPTSGEEADAEMSYDSTARQTTAAGAAAAHPSKRTKRHSTAHDDDDGERSSTTEASSAIEERVHNRRKSSAASNGMPAPKAADSKPIPPPAQAGSLAPVGFSMNPPPTDRAVRVYADGVFDLFHLGHMRQLEQAKKAFPNTYLLVGIPNDTETHKRKGLTVLNDKERAETLRHCKWVDEVIEDAPWIVTPQFLDLHEIDYVAHDDEPYVSAESDDIYRPCKEAGKFLVTQRTEGISTTYIITKIVRDYEKYIYRQLKRGTSRQELNVSWLKKNELDLKRHVAELRDTIKNNWSTTGRELRDEFRSYWAPTRPSSPSPYLFGTSGGTGGRQSPESSAASGAGGAPGSKNPLLHIDMPSRPHSPHTEFANGYSLGLIGGVRSWMRNRTTPGGSVPASDTYSDEEDPLSPKTGNINGSPGKASAEQQIMTEQRKSSTGSLKG